MFGLWLTMYQHQDVPRWWYQSNDWNIKDLIRGYRYGYRKFKITRQPIDPRAL